MGGREKIILSVEIKQKTIQFNVGQLVYNEDIWMQIIMYLTFFLRGAQGY